MYKQLEIIHNAIADALDGKVERDINLLVSLLSTNQDISFSAISKKRGKYEDNSVTLSVYDYDFKLIIDYTVSARHVNVYQSTINDDGNIVDWWRQSGYAVIDCNVSDDCNDLLSDIVNMVIGLSDGLDLKRA